MKKGVTILAFLLLIFFVHIGLQWIEKQALGWYHTLALPSWTVTQLGLVRIWLAVYFYLN